MNVLDLLSRLERVRQTGPGQWEARCPAHEDREPSLSIAEGQDGKTVLHCHAGCSVNAIVGKLGLKLSNLFADAPNGNGKGNGKRDLGPIVATYDYQDENGALLYQVTRHDPKDFRQRRPDGNGGWDWHKHPRQVLYHLPELLKADFGGGPWDTRIYLHEGEKATDRATREGLLSTCHAGGADAKIDVEMMKPLTRAEVVIVADNDEPGRKHARNVAALCRGLAARVKVLEHLPGLDAPGADAFDWFEAGHTAGELEGLADAQPAWEPSQDVEEAESRGEGEAPGADSQGFARTDLGNAERLVAAHGAELRFNVDSGKWLTWTGCLWEQDDTFAVERLAAEIIRGIREEAAREPDKDRAKKLWDHALRSESAGKLAAMCDLARKRPGVPIRTSDLDANPYLLNVENGLLDLSEDPPRLREHDPAALCTRIAHTRYDPRADCPRWLKFLAEVFPGSDELPEYLRLKAGYYLTGSTREQDVDFWVGKGGNGKRRALEVLSEILGGYADTTPFSTFLQDRDSATNDLAALVGARLVSASEGGGGQAFDEELLKRVSGEDPIKCRFLYREFFTYIPTYKVLFTTNDVPRFSSQNRAMKRRIRVVTFRQTFYFRWEGKQPVRDETLAAQLREELPGILAWAVSGCREWRRSGLAVPSSVRQDSEDLFVSMDPLADFLAEEFVLQPSARIRTCDAWECYVRFCEQRGVKRLAIRSQNALTRALQQRDGIEYKPMREGRFLVGLGLRRMDEKGAL